METVVKILLVVLISSFCMAGSLEPSAAPAPTMKTLDQVEPRIPIPGSSVAVGTFTISQSGSYYLTGDRLCSGHGIRVDVNDVTIDLMGYSLIGSDSSNAGIAMYGRSNVEIRNGTIRNFRWHGIMEYNTDYNAKNHRIINVRLIDNGKAGVSYCGIYIQGVNHLVKDCTIIGNGDGISIGRGCLVIGNIVSKNTDDGIVASDGSTVIGNTVYYNASRGIVLGMYCMADQNTAYNNTPNLTSGVGCVLGTNCVP